MMSNLSRRQLFQLSALGIGGSSASGWLGALAASSSAKPAPPKKCILLWMDGGPSQHETFDMKPDAPADIRGEYKPIDTSVPGIRVAENFPKLAKQMHHAAVIRSMNTGEAEHGRARIYLHTGYKQGTGGLKFPTMGSLVTAGAKLPETELPNFVVTGMHLNPANWSYVSSPGYLGPRHAPLIVNDTKTGLRNLKPADDAEFDERQSLLQSMTDSFLRENPAAVAATQRTVYERAVQLMKSSKGKAFDLSLESAKVHETYGQHAFGQGCLLARRLVEVGVPFVEVYHSPTPGGWDTHTAARYKEVKTMTAPQLDQGMSALIDDLAQRGLLNDTLVIWMGEFGRTPKVKPDGGRDHYGRAWSSVLLGGGVQGGKVIGRTDAQGGTVEDQPVSAADFMATVCRLLGVDHEQTIDVRDRPVRLIDSVARPIDHLLKA
jgi:hypothetical protein